MSTGDVTLNQHAVDDMAAVLARIARGVGDQADCLVWSNQRHMWWAPDRAGYTPYLEAAGRYTRADAEHIARDAACDGQVAYHVTGPRGEPLTVAPERVVSAPEASPVWSSTAPVFTPPPVAVDAATTALVDHVRQSPDDLRAAVQAALVAAARAHNRLPFVVDWPGRMTPAQLEEFRQGILAAASRPPVFLPGGETFLTQTSGGALDTSGIEPDLSWPVPAQAVEYVVYTAYPQYSEAAGDSTLVASDRVRHRSREDAWRHGLANIGSDDFRIAIVNGGTLAGVGWGAGPDAVDFDLAEEDPTKVAETIGAEVTP